MRKLLGRLGLLWSICIPVLCQAQSLEGEIVNRLNGTALKGVKIKVVDQDRSFQTDKKGRFRIEDLELGVNWIEITHPGFKSQKRELFFEKDFQEKRWKIHLAPGPSTQFDEETSIGNRLSTAPTESPFFTQHVRQDAIREYASRNMSEAMIKVPGMWIQEFGPSQSTPVLRGLGGDFTSIMMDGIRINHGLMGAYSPTLIGNIDPIHLSHMDVLFGSASTQYGSDAIGGVINLQSKDPHFADEGIEIHGDLLLRFQGAGTEQGAASTLQFNSSRLALLTSYSNRNLGGLVPGTFGGEFQQEAALVKGKVKISQRHMLSLSYQRHTQRNVQSIESGRLVSDFTETLKPQQWQMATARLVSRFDNKWLKEMRITGAFQQYNENRNQEYRRDPLFRKEENQSQTWSGIFEIHSQPNIYWDIVSGVEIYQEDILSRASQGRSGFYDLKPATPAYLDAAQAGSMDIYSLHTLKLLKLKLSFGGRAHRSLISGQDPNFGELNIKPQTFSGNISAVYPLTRHISLSSSINTGFRTPNVRDISNFGIQEVQFVLPTDSLNAERSFSSQIGLKAKTQGFMGSIVLYRTRLHDLIDWVPGTHLGNYMYEGRQVVQQLNSGQAYIQGVEASVEIPLTTTMAFYGSILYTSGENEDQSKLSRIPPVNGRLGFRLRSKTGIWTRLEWQKAGSQQSLSEEDIQNPYIGPTGTASWNILNFHIGYDFNWGYMTLGVQNFFDQEYRIHGSHVKAMDQAVLLSMQLGF